MKYVAVFERISGAGIDSVKDHQHCSCEGIKMFSKGAMFRFGPFLDPVTFLFDRFGSVDTKIVI
jgi:hypothetical protein